MNTEISKVLSELQSYCELEQFKGYDPYDGLNSKFFQKLPILPDTKIGRLFWIQLFKRLPVNLRPYVGIEKDYNPKALALFINGYANLSKLDAEKDYREKIDLLAEKILSFTAKGYSGDCWGYNFDWESRAFFQPKFSPTIVASVFVANSLLDAYEITKNEKYLRSARSTADYILNDLNRTEGKDGTFAFSYSKLDKSIIFNASLLGSRLLSRLYSLTGETELADIARKSVAFCCNYQKADGSWSYGTYHFHQWIDSFHTGYNLECIHAYQQFTGDRSFNQHLESGLAYYVSTFFTTEGISKYYNNKVYPIDIHAPAQLIITLSKLGKFQQHKDTLDKVISWTLSNMKDPQGYFYFQKKKYIQNRIPYMRWSQAWMFYSLSEYLLASKMHEHDHLIRQHTN